MTDSNEKPGEDPGPDWTPINAFMPMGVQGHGGRELAQRIKAWLYIGEKNESQKKV
jgi:hypothetical protein